MKKIPALLILLSILSPGMAQAQYQVGDHIENFTLPDTSGNMVSLYDYIDRLVVLAFWENG